MKRYLFLTLAVLLCTLSASAYDFKVDGIAYNKNDDGKSVRVASGVDYKGDIVIPENITYDGVTYSVTSIGENAFSGCTGLASVTIPNTVSFIGDVAFEETPWYNNQPDGVFYIGDVAYKFKGGMASGTAIYIKEGTVSISPGAFRGCTGLTSVTIPNSVAEIGFDTFQGCI